MRSSDDPQPRPGPGETRHGPTRAREALALTVVFALAYAGLGLLLQERAPRLYVELDQAFDAAGFRPEMDVGNPDAATVRLFGLDRHAPSTSALWYVRNSTPRVLLTRQWIVNVGTSWFSHCGLWIAV